MPPWAHTDPVTVTSSSARKNMPYSIYRTRYLNNGGLIRLVLFALDWLPGLVRIETCHLRGQRRGSRAQILFVHDSTVVHDERLDSRVAVFRRICNQREAADHISLHDVRLRAARRIGTLRGQD